jgi:hypothetical protein
LCNLYLPYKYWTVFSLTGQQHEIFTIYCSFAVRDDSSSISQPILGENLKKRRRQKKIPDTAAKGKKEPGNLILLHLYSRFKLLGTARACPEAAGDGNQLTAQEVSSY